MTATTLIHFLAASMAITLAPGPDNLFVLSQGITRGRSAALITAIGMCSGISVHTTAAAFGLSAILSSSPVAFHLIKICGTAYLLFLAWKTLQPRPAIHLAAEQPPIATLFRRGFLMNVLNPKVALFFLAFLPQFLTPETPHPALQMLFLGVVFMAQATLIFSLIAFFAGGIGSYLLTRPRIARYFDWLTAGIFASLAIRLALAEA